MLEDSFFGAISEAVSAHVPDPVGPCTTRTLRRQSGKIGTTFPP